MTDTDREHIRNEQDRLIALAEDRYPDYFHISEDYPGSPTIGELRRFICPEWRWLVQSVTAELESEAN